MAGGRKAKQSLRADREGPRVGEARGGGAGSCAHSWRSRGIRHGPLPLAGWGDLPGELHGEILRLVPLRDATAARGVSPEMRDEVDEVWRAWGIRATAEDGREFIRTRFGRITHEDVPQFSPLDVYAMGGTHAQHLASLGLWWPALVAGPPDINAGTLGPVVEVLDQTPLMVALRAQRPVGRGADGKVEWANALGDEEAARMVRAAVAMGGNVNPRLLRTKPLLSYCAEQGFVEAVKACLAVGAEVDAVERESISHGWCIKATPLQLAGWGASARSGGYESVVEALLAAGASPTYVPGKENQSSLLCSRCGADTTPGVVRMLVEAGAELNAGDCEGLTPVAHAASNCNFALGVCGFAAGGGGGPGGER